MIKKRAARLTQEQKSKLFDMLKGGESKTEAAKKLGVAYHQVIKFAQRNVPGKKRGKKSKPPQAAKAPGASQTPATAERLWRLIQFKEKEIVTLKALLAKKVQAEESALEAQKAKLAELAMKSK